MNDKSDDGYMLRADNPLTEKVLSIETNAPLEVYVGPPEWGKKEWIGKLYPHGTRDKQFFEIMSRNFNTVEFNSLFYGIPSIKKILEWKEKSPENFKFCPKFPKSITHDKKLIGAEAETEQFCEAVFALGNNLGRSFLQFSEYHLPRLSILERYLKSLPKALLVSVELRSEKLFSDATLWTETCSMFQELGVGTVIRDAVEARDAVHMTLSTNSMMLRFLASDLTQGYRRIDEWCVRIKEWVAKGLKSIYIFAHTYDGIHVPELALYFVRKLNQTLNLNIKEPYLFPQSEQLKLF